MRRNLTLLAMILFASLVFSACGAGSSQKSSDMATGAPAPAESPRPAESAPMAPGSDAATGSVGVEIPTDRKMILNANYDIRVKDTDEAVTRIDQAVRASGGYVQEAKQSGTKERGRTVNLVARVPARQFGAMKDLVRGLGELINQREWADDVTDAYVDLEERIKAKEIHLARLNSHFAQAGTIREMIELEQEIGRVTADLESMKGRMKVMSNQVEFSTFIVNLTEPGVPVPIQAPKTVWERMTRGFTESWNGVINFTGDLAVFLVSALPVLVYMALLLGLVWWIARSVVRRLDRRRGLTPPAGPGSQHYGPVPPIMPEAPKDPEQKQ